MENHQPGCSLLTIDYPYINHILTIFNSFLYVTWHQTTNQVAMSQFLFQQKRRYLAPQLQLTQQALEALAGTWAKAAGCPNPMAFFPTFQCFKRMGKGF
jgi:hypothetical protein